MKMGPVWDFDWSVNGPYLTKYRNMTADATDGLRSAGNWFAALYNNSPEFRVALAERYSELRGGFEDTIIAVKNNKSRLANAAGRDKIRWHLFRVQHNYDKCYEDVIEWVEARLLWLDTAFSMPTN